jgi:DNA-binding transcriptional LysR family regulator
MGMTNDVKAPPPVSASPPPRSPSLDELRAFCLAVDLGGIGRAAQRLHLSQPAASKRLRSLETLVGTPLLLRSPHGVTMTPAGERLYAHARRLIADSDELAGLLEQIRGSSQTVHLAISHTAAEYLMPKALVTMHHHSSAAVEVLIANSRLVKSMLAAGQADIGVAAFLAGETVPHAGGRTLIEDEIVIAVPLAHPWARRSSITPAELLATPIVLRDPDAHTRQVFDEVLTAAGLPAPQPAAEVGSTQAAKDEAHELCLPTALSRLALAPADRLEIVPIEGLRFPRRFCLLYPAGGPSPAAAHLLDAFQETAAALRPR